jgi:hypothetical protein
VNTAFKKETFQEAKIKLCFLPCLTEQKKRKMKEKPDKHRNNSSLFAREATIFFKSSTTSGWQ